MRIAVVGGGPAGLYFAYLWKRRHPDSELHLFEQNESEATFGFGVVFSDEALEFLRADDAETVDDIAPRMERWRNITLTLKGQSITIDGVGFFSIGRLELLTHFQDRARSAGVSSRHGVKIKSLSELEGYDLIVGADGLNSFVRRCFELDFGASVSHSSNKFIWYGTTKRFETLSQTFVETDLGALTAHHYRYSPQGSTFLVECDRPTWERYGFAAKTDGESRDQCERIFTDALDGHALLSNQSVWRNFPWVWNERWSVGNKVLIGDALHSAHFSIGSGTRLALEDAIALVKALEKYPGDIPGALMAFEASRKPAVEKLVSAAHRSAEWYENFTEAMKLDVLDFAHSYITRSGRIDSNRLRKISPSFMAQYDASRARMHRFSPGGMNSNGSAHE